MWKKILGGIAGSFMLLRWSRRFFLAWRMAAGTGAHLIISPFAILAYLATSVALLVGFWKTDGRWTKMTGIAFVALQIASIGAVASMA